MSATSSDMRRGYVPLPSIWVESEKYEQQRLPLQRIGVQPNMVHKRQPGEDSYELTLPVMDLKERSPRPKTVIAAVQSEPRNARIYCDGKFLGQTPLLLTYKDPQGVSNDVFQSNALTAFADGYLSKTLMPKLMMSEDNYILFALEPDPNYHGVSSSLEVLPGNSSDDYERAKSEYEEALAAYEKANAQYHAITGITVLSDRGYSGSKLAPLGHLANMITRDGAKRELDTAQERLDRAKERLQTLAGK